MSWKDKKLGSRTTTTIIPALSGWCVAVLMADSDSLHCEPIIAWAIDRHERDDEGVPSDDPDRDLFRFVEHRATPITLNNLITNTDDWAIKTPDGKFSFYGVLICDNEVDAIAEMKERREECGEREEVTR